jgi:hypothetical protein
MVSHTRLLHHKGQSGRRPFPFRRPSSVVEQLFRKPQVVGSSPMGGSSFKFKQLQRGNLVVFATTQLLIVIVTHTKRNRWVTLLYS